MARQKQNAEKSLQCRAPSMALATRETLRVPTDSGETFGGDQEKIAAIKLNYFRSAHEL
jgi:hypothetical protein